TFNATANTSDDWAIAAVELNAAAVILPPPGQATSPNPADSATDVSLTTSLSWTAGSGATSHDVYFGTDSTPDAGEFQINQTGTTFEPGLLTAGTTYYWRIDEKNAGGTTEGAVWSFTTIPAPPSPATNPSPADSASGIDIDINLSWSAGTGATSHDVYFGTDSTPDAGEFQINQTGTSFDPGTLTNYTTYYWRIDEINAGGTTTGTVWSFTTEGIAPIITSTAITTAAVNQAYSYDVDATGTPAPTFSLSVSPSGMTIDSETGVISWTPDSSQLGLNAVTVVASNGQSPDDTQSFDIDVAGVAPTITSTAITTANVNEAYSYTVTADGIPAATFSLSVSPAGMTIDSGTGG
ncbi:MAG: Ig domain-containing protein, partial [Phycisphaerae bacterium]